RREHAGDRDRAAAGGRARRHGARPRGDARPGAGGRMSHEEEFRRLFRAEATEQLDRLADTVLELESEGGGAGLVATLFRDAHTLKSSAALVGLPLVSEIAHALEDLLGELRAGTRAVSAGLADGVLDVVDGLRG